jgi:hypothetical protein
VRERSEEYNDNNANTEVEYGLYLPRLQRRSGRLQSVEASVEGILRERNNGASNPKAFCESVVDRQMQLDDWTADRGWRGI